MNQDRIAQRCGAMEIEELVRAVTVDRDENTDQFREVALGVLRDRGVELRDFVDMVQVRLNDSADRSMSTGEALDQLGVELAPWDALLFTSCLSDVLAVQRMSYGWVVHFYGGEQYGGSFLIESRDRLRDVLSEFLQMQDWRRLAGEEHHLDNWRTLIDTDSRELVESVTADLDVEGIAYIVRAPRFAPGDDASLDILVPPENLDQALELIEDTEETVDDLYLQAEELVESGERERELEVYDELVDTDPDNPAVHYNRGSLLIELRRWDEAADSLVEAVAIGLREAKSNLELTGRKGGGPGGIMGVYALLLRGLTSAARPQESGPSRPQYPDYIDDADILLDRLRGHLPDNKKILHCLASVARLRNDTAGAEARYRAILRLDPDDEVAYFNLGYLHSERGGEEPG